jgi:hypothetical protein
MVENDWKENPNGEKYTQRLGEAGRPGVPARLDELHRPSTENAYREAYQQHAPEEPREHEVLRGSRETGGGTGKAGGVAAAVNGQDESCRRVARSCWPAQKSFRLALAVHSEASTYSLVDTYS